MKKLIGNRPIIFLWENFGPLHVDRCEAVARAMPARAIVGVEVLAESSEYDWVSEKGQLFEKLTLSSATSRRPWSPWRILSTIVRVRPEAIFFCHYQKIEILIAASASRLLGIKTFTMNDSKFDDYPRALWREVIKSIFFLPYQGALVGSRRSSEYLNFLGIDSRDIATGYDSISTDRIRYLAKSPPAPAGAPFSQRHFTIVARLIPKKNIELALQALARLFASGKTRRLVICGSGPMEGHLKALSSELGIMHLVEFRGFVQTSDVCKTLATTLALILPSTEEQFGQVIPEAMAMGVPVLASDNCGARDHLILTGVNGFIFEPNNVAGLAYFMSLMMDEEATWRSMASDALRLSARGDVSSFVEGVDQLLEGRSRLSLRSDTSELDGDKAEPFPMGSLKRCA